jgi:hypothetical protein
LESKLNSLIYNYYKNKSKDNLDLIKIFLDDEKIEFDKIALSEQTIFFLNERKVSVNFKRNSLTKKQVIRSPLYGAKGSVTRNEVSDKDGNIILIRHEPRT